MEWGYGRREGVVGQTQQAGQHSVGLVRHGGAEVALFQSPCQPRTQPNPRPRHIQAIVSRMFACYLAQRARPLLAPSCRPTAWGLRASRRRPARPARPPMAPYDASHRSCAWLPYAPLPIWSLKCPLAGKPRSRHTGRSRTPRRSAGSGGILETPAACIRRTVKSRSWMSRPWAPARLIRLGVCI